MSSRLTRILIVLAGVMGADGVMLAAAAAHQADAVRLASASSMLLFHATAVLAVAPGTAAVTSAKQAGSKGRVSRCIEICPATLADRANRAASPSLCAQAYSSAV